MSIVDPSQNHRDQNDTMNFKEDFKENFIIEGMEKVDSLLNMVESSIMKWYYKGKKYEKVSADIQKNNSPDKNNRTSKQ
jgi:hypothetical protein